MKLVFALILIGMLAGCAHKKPIMEGCKKLPLSNRDWSVCERQVE